MFLNGQILGLSQKEIQARFEEIASFADIGEFIEQPVKTYSSGMFVRLAFAVQAHIDASIGLLTKRWRLAMFFFVKNAMRASTDFESLVQQYC